MCGRPPLILLLSRTTSHDAGSTGLVGSVAMVDRYGLFLGADVCRPRRKKVLRYYGPRHPMYDFVLRISLLGISNFTRANLP